MLASDRRELGCGRERGSSKVSRGAIESAMEDPGISSAKPRDERWVCNAGQNPVLLEFFREAVQALYVVPWLPR